MLAFAYCSEPLSPKIGNFYNALRMLKKGNDTQQVDKKNYSFRFCTWYHLKGPRYCATRCFNLHTCKSGPHMPYAPICPLLSNGKGNINGVRHLWGCEAVIDSKFGPHGLWHHPLELPWIGDVQGLCNLFEWSLFIQHGIHVLNQVCSWRSQILVCHGFRISSSPLCDTNSNLQLHRFCH